MSYTPTEWNNGDVITAEKLNKLESGIETAAGGSSAMLVELTHVSTGPHDIYKSDILAAEVISAYKNGAQVVFHFPLEPDSSSDDNREAWASLNGYSTTNINGTHFSINPDIFSNYSLDVIYIGEDGYIHFEISAGK